MKAKLLIILSLFASIYGNGQAIYTSHTSSSSSVGTGGYYSVYAGVDAGFNGSSSTRDNTFIGYEAGKANTEGDNNLYAGYRAGTNCLSSYNTFLGAEAGLNSGSVVYNVFVGSQSGRSNISGSHNIYVGSDSGHNNTAGRGNVFLGSNSGYNSAGEYNVFLGYRAGYSETGNNRLYIHNNDTSKPLVYGEFDNRFVKFNAYKVGIGYEGTTGFGDFPGLSNVPNASIYRLFVRGGILAEEVRIRLQSEWADYVFNDDYVLLPLEELQNYIEENKHLPNMPSAKEIAEEGIAVGNIIKLQQEKIEELSLYIIEQNERNKEQERRIEKLEEQVQLFLNKQ